MFWARYQVLWWAIFGQVIIAGLLIRTGIAHFNREELLGRELDTLNLPWAWRIYREALVLKRNPAENWWQRTVWQPLKTMKWPLILSLGIMVGASLVGVSQADVYSIPPGLLEWENLEQGFVAGVDEIGPIRFYSVEGIGFVFLHNLRVIALASLLGVFSFGVLGVLILSLPFALIGYFAAIAAQTGLSPWSFLLGFVLPHGIVEIPAIVLTGALIIRLGLILVTPQEDSTIGEAWLRALAEWTKVVVFVVLPLFLMAAVLEVYLTPRAALWIFQ